MNKWQVICPVSALAVFLVVYPLLYGLPGSRDYKYYINSRAREIGKDLIATTNSAHLVAIDPALRVNLSRVLSSPTHIANVLYGDEPPPIGDGKACSRLSLTNDLGQGIVLRLSQDTNWGS